MKWIFFPLCSVLHNQILQKRINEIMFTERLCRTINSISHTSDIVPDLTVETLDKTSQSYRELLKLSQPMVVKVITQLGVVKVTTT